MTALKVYIPIDVIGIYSGNPFDTELVSALENSDCEVAHGLFRLASRESRWDVINIQWPEAIFSWLEPDRTKLSWLDETLHRFGLTSRIVATVHNESPHYGDSERFSDLYRMVYRHAQAFVHLGTASESLLRARFPEETSDKIHRVIPIGNYLVFGAEVSRSEARRQLRLPVSGKIVLVVGALRSQDEFDLLKDSLSGWIGTDCLLLFRAKIANWQPPMRYGTITGRAASEFKRYRLSSSLRRRDRVVFEPGPVTHDEMAVLLSASDVVFIPRRRVLNSANVALAFTYGKIVVGPDVGNVGQILRATGNPVFDPEAGPSAVALAIRRALDLVGSGLGDANRHVALVEWSWEAIGARYRSLYAELLAR